MSAISSARRLAIALNPGAFVLQWLGSRSWRRSLTGIPVILATVAAVILHTKAARELGNNRFDHYLQAGAKSLDDDHLPEANLRLRRALLIKPGNLDTRFQYARLANAQGNVRQAVEAMSSLTQGNSSVAAAATRWLIARFQTKQSIGPDDRQQLIKLLERLVALEPQSSDAHEMLATLYWSAGLKDRSVRQLTEAANLRPELLLQLAQLQLQAQNPEAAIKAARNAEQEFVPRLEKDPRSEKIRLLVASALLMQNNHAEAARYLRDGLLLQPSGDLKAALAQTLAAWAGHDARVKGSPIPLEKVGEALRLDPKCIPALAMLVQASKDGSNNQAEAIELLEKRLADGEAPWVLHLLLGTAAAEKQDAATAERHLEQALKLNPDAAATLNNLAWVLGNGSEENLGRALEMINSAIRMHPTNAAFHETRGQILARMGKFQDALADFEFALPIFNRTEPLRPQLPALHLAIAGVYEKLGDEGMAKQHRALSEEAKAPKNGPDGKN